jgi:hypothetical protein
MAVRQGGACGPCWQVTLPLPSGPRGNSLYAAILIVDLPAPALAAVLSVGLLIPALIAMTGHRFEGGFNLLIVALTCFWILLLDLRAEPMRLELEGVHP